MSWREIILAGSLVRIVTSRPSASTPSTSVNTNEATILFYHDFNLFAASVVAADACSTTYIFDCTAAGCNLSGQVTHTQSALGYDETFSPTRDPAIMGVSMSCSAISGSNAAVCTSTRSIAHGAVEASSITLTGVDASPAFVQITAGGELLAMATGECDLSTRSTKSSTSSVPVTAPAIVPVTLSETSSHPSTTLMSSSSKEVIVTVPFLTSWSTALAASIISADACQTTMALQCADASACPGLTGTIMASAGPSWYEHNFTALTSNQATSISESCTFITGQATCKEIAQYSLSATASANTTTPTMSYSNGTIRVTGGQDKILAVMGSRKATEE
ncbi:hypothetical protein LTR78_009705 [Recurvomyces mirabilis]|uniref:Uncharacterized protein n=1 Tax=Recurvomyces mirabilis TaxID=574656 RepID=A0AAE0WGG7_9PEZI|nr:hypothetical protein LTR78_009705 [Recurvomyces mirabilis]